MSFASVTYMVLGNLRNLAEPLFPDLQNGDRTSPAGSFWDRNKRKVGMNLKVENVWDGA